MSKQKFSVTLLQKYQDMIEGKYAPLLAAAERATAPLRWKIQEDVKADLGVSEIVSAIAKAEEVVNSLKAQYRAVTGRNFERFGSWGDEDKIGAEVQRRLREQDGVYERIMEEKTQTIEKLWLAQGPEELTSLVKNVNLDDFRLQIEKLESRTSDIKMIEE